MAVQLLAPREGRLFPDCSFPCQGAFCGLLVGMVLGLIRMVLDFVYMQPRCDEEDNRPAVVKYVHYLYFSVILSLVTLAVVVAISLLTEPPPEAMVRSAKRELISGQPWSEIHLQNAGPHMPCKGMGSPYWWDCCRARSTQFHTPVQLRAAWDTHKCARKCVRVHARSCAAPCHRVW